ncbi:MvaI/BcnI family restriction endonuclease [Bacteroides fragilis]|uniref:MvaI/BcnI family restriction endonuclease n=1 Tax=Bacteroides fragilis TaxID=817 RepID=UPI0022AA1F33|nr:MvaI/BcnI family restriction endonuclease [Bacteroides fragilis]MCZ2632011.1 MvaI/BcnI family restriction endonuclease [Bacteroides fragilis]
MRSFFLEHDIHDNKEYFRYKRIEHTKNPNVGQFDMLLEQNLITVDLLLSRPSGHGDTYSFKIKKKAMSLLFPESIIHDLML